MYSTFVTRSLVSPNVLLASPTKKGTSGWRPFFSSLIHSYTKTRKNLPVLGGLITKLTVPLLFTTSIYSTGCAICSHTPCFPAAHAFPDYFWGAGVGFMGRWLRNNMYNIELAPPPHFMDDRDGAMLSVCCTTPHAQHATRRCRRSRGRKEFHLQIQKDGGARAGPCHSKDVRGEVKNNPESPYFELSVHRRGKVT